VATQSLWLPCLLTQLLPSPTGSRGGTAWKESFRLSDLKEIKWDLGSFTYDSDWYIQAFITVTQTFELAWREVMLLLDQILPSLEQQRILIRPLRQAMIITLKSLC
jgi:hypothetical protein